MAKVTTPLMHRMNYNLLSISSVSVVHRKVNGVK